MKLKGLVAIVTGAGGVVGQTIACALSREGADLAIVTLKSNSNELLRKIEELGSRAIAIYCDVTDKGSVDKMVARTAEAFGKIDLLINNAGVSVNTPLEELSVENWDKVMTVNLKGVFLCSVAAAREMMKRNKGNIINIGSALAHNCFPNRGAFGPSKAGVLSLTRQMAMEWAKYNIRVNGVSPGPIMNPATAGALKNQDMKQRIKKIPLGRVAAPEEIANAVTFLASEDSSYITGQMIIVDGGSILTSYLYP